jgi:hypothetical protein
MLLSVGGKGGYVVILPEDEMKRIINKEGQLCRHCNTPVVKSIPKRTIKKTQPYYYSYNFICPSCKAIYNPKEAKVLNKRFKTIYKNNKPHGIRNEDGFVLFFPSISKYSGQEERYRKEIEDQFKLADFLVQQLEASSF